MAKIFISYRRGDTAGHTGRLLDVLKRTFGDNQVFLDIEDIEAGSDFVKAIDRSVSACAVLLAIIGPRWLNAMDGRGRRRLDDRNDFVRLEIVTALRRNVRVIPVLVDDAEMPAAEELPEDLQALVRRQAVELTDKRWDYDVEVLVQALARVEGIKRERAPEPPPPHSQPPAKPKRGVVKTMARLVATLVLLAGAVALVRTQVPFASAPVTTVAETQYTTVADTTPVADSASYEGDAGGYADPPNVSEDYDHSGFEKVSATSYYSSSATSSHAEDERSLDDAPADSPSPVNLTGAWADDEGGVFRIEQTADTLAVLVEASDGSGLHQFYGSGTVDGHAVQVALAHYGTGIPINMNLTVSNDGRRMDGTLSLPYDPSVTEDVVLLRE